MHVWKWLYNNFQNSNGMNHTCEKTLTIKAVVNFPSFAVNPLQSLIMTTPCLNYHQSLEMIIKWVRSRDWCNIFTKSERQTGVQYIYILEKKTRAQVYKRENAFWQI